MYIPAYTDTVTSNCQPSVRFTRNVVLLLRYMFSQGTLYLSLYAIAILGDWSTTTIACLLPLTRIQAQIPERKQHLRHLATPSFDLRSHQSHLETRDSHLSSLMCCLFAPKSRGKEQSQSADISNALYTHVGPLILLRSFSLPHVSLPLLVSLACAQLLSLTLSLLCSAVCFCLLCL